MWNVEQRTDIVSQIVHFPKLQRGQRHVPSITFPSLECAKAKTAAGEDVHDVYQTCLQAIAEDGLRGEILTRTKERFGNQSAVRAINQEPPDYFSFDHAGVEPTNITPKGNHNTHADPCGAEFAGAAIWDNVQWARAFPRRDPNEVIPPMALVHAYFYSSEDASMALSQVNNELHQKSSREERSRSPAQTQASAGNQGFHKDPNAASSSAGLVQKTEIGHTSAQWTDKQQPKPRL